MGKKLHRILAEAAVEVLRAIFEEGMVADRAVARVLGSHPKWGKRDRALVAETVYEVVRSRRSLAVLAGAEDWWSICGFWWARQGMTRPEWATWDEVPEALRVEREMTLRNLPRAVRLSLPDAFDALGVAELGPAWEEELSALNHAAPVFLRVNPRRGHAAAVTAELESVGVAVEPVPGCPWGLKVLPGKAVPAQLRESGRFEIQDAASQQVAPFLEVSPGMRVVDACAGAGGKTLHLAALLEGKGDLLAMDIEERKLETLRTRAARATVKVRTAVFSDAAVMAMAGQADRVLVDAPCSGSGTLRRQADLKYRITPESLAAVQEVQRNVLSRCVPLVRPGGRLVYATCSIFPSENEAQAAWFTAAHPGFVQEAENRLSPSVSGWDGFYMVRWQRLE